MRFRNVSVLIRMCKRYGPRSRKHLYSLGILACGLAMYMVRIKSKVCYWSNRGVTKTGKISGKEESIKKKVTGGTLMGWTFQEIKKPCRNRVLYPGPAFISFRQAGWNRHRQPQLQRRLNQHTCEGGRPACRQAGFELACRSQDNYDNEGRPAASTNSRITFLLVLFFLLETLCPFLISRISLSFLPPFWFQIALRI